MERCVDVRPPGSAARRRRDGHGSFISVAFLTGLVFVPFVVATGLLTEGRESGRLPADITETSLRGTLAIAGRSDAPSPVAALPHR